MICHQQQILIGLNNDPKFLKLKLSFFNYPDLHNYSKVFLYIYNYIKKKLCKVKACNGIVYTITFNYTNTQGVVLYNNTIIIKNCKKINDYSNNINEQILKSFNSFVKGDLFVDSIQNELVKAAIAYGVSNNFLNAIKENITYFQAYTPGTSGGSTSSNETPIINIYQYDADGNKLSVTSDNVIQLLSSTLDFTYAFIFINPDYTYSIQTTITDVSVVMSGAGGGGGVGSTWIGNVDSGNNGCGGGGGGSGGQFVVNSHIIIPTQQQMNISLGIFGLPATYTSSSGIFSASGSGGETSFTSSDISYTASGGLGGYNGLSTGTYSGGNGGTSVNTDGSGYGGKGGGYSNSRKGSTGGTGYTSYIESDGFPALCISAGGGGGGGSSYYIGLIEPTISYGNAGNGGNTGGGGGGGSGCANNINAKAGIGTTNYTGTSYTGLNGGTGSYNNTSGLITVGNGGAGSWGSGGAGSGTNAQFGKTYKDFSGGQGGSGVVIVYLYYS